MALKLSTTLPSASPSEAVRSVISVASGVVTERVLTPRLLRRWPSAAVTVIVYCVFSDRPEKTY